MWQESLSRFCRLLCDCSTRLTNIGQRNRSESSSEQCCHAYHRCRSSPMHDDFERRSEELAMNKEELMRQGSHESEKFIKFGPMLLKEPSCRTALLVAPTVDDGFFTMQNMLAKSGWQSAVAASEEEAEERFMNLWPHLVVVDARKSVAAKQKKAAFTVEAIMRKLRSLTEDDGTVILAIVDKIVYDDKLQRDLVANGATKLLKCCPRALAEELIWIERCVLPLQFRLRSCGALFTALEHVDCAVEITSNDRDVQYVNGNYEQLTGCHKDDVLGTLSSDLRRKSLPKETAGVRTSSTSSAGPVKLSPRPNGHRKPRTVSAGAVAPSTLITDHSHDHMNVNDTKSSYRPTSPRFGSSLPTTTLTETVQISEASSSFAVKNGDDEANGWRCIPAPGPSNQHQFVYVKHLSAGECGKGGLYRRQPSIRLGHAFVDTPVSEIIAILRDVQKRCGNDEEVRNPIQKVVKILNSTELYSPLITRFKQEDKVASDLFGGLVLNGPLTNLHRSRKTSLSETMRHDFHHKGGRNEVNALRSVAPDVRSALNLEETWKFDIFELERLTFRRPLVHLGMKIFQRWRVDAFLQCTESSLRSWLEVMEAHYHPENSYHNSTHAADVLQASAYYLGKETIANMIEHADAVAVLLASVVHDLDHPGKGSAFLINTRHPLALLYNDVSVLESHHAALSFQLSLSDPRLNIFARLGRQDFMSLRKSVVDMVLATDMNKHFEYLAKFQQTILVEEEDIDAPAPDKDRIDPRRIVCRILIKCADVSNPSRPWKQCKEWAYRIVEEYFIQTAEERAKSLPLTMQVFDRDTCNVPQTQLSFIDMFIKEMFRSWGKFGRMPELEEHIEENYKHWEEEKKIWPKQRMLEYSRIQAYLKHRDSFRHIMSSSLTDSNTRSSVDSIGSAPPALVTTVHHSSKDGSPHAVITINNDQQILETTVESPVQSTSSVSLV